VNLGDSGDLFPGLPIVREAGVRLLRGVLLLAVLAAGQVLTPGAGAHASPVENFEVTDPNDPCRRTSWLAGTTELCRGVVVYRDYVVDDYGAAEPLDNTNETVLLGSLSRTEGDQRYADGAKAGTADLVDLSVRLDGDRLIAVFEVNALYRRGSTIGALAIDTDDDRSTGGGTWPGLGIESEGWEVIKKVTTGNTDSNLLRLTMPKPSGTRWRLQAVTAKADGTVMNVAFRGANEDAGLAGSSWFEGKQAAALADGDITQFGTTVDVADLRNGVTRRARHTAPGFHERVFTSAYTIGTGEGYTYEPEYGRHGDSGQVCEQEFATVGRYQPYSVYVPQGSERKGLQLYLHGCNANHTSQIDGEGLQTQFGDNLNRVIVAPLGRGPVGYYSDISEADVFEAVRDAQATYRLDRSRWFISGYSMGGYGTLRLGSLYPDLWAGATNWVGFTGDAANNPTGEKPGDYPSGAIGNVIDFVGNLEWVPSEHLYAGGDYLVHAQTHTALALRLDEVGVDHEYFLHPAAEHLTFVLLDEWSKEAAKSEGRTVVADPPRVRFRTDASLAYPKYGIRHDRAYWVSRIRAAAEGYSDVDLTSYGCGKALPVREAGNDAGAQPVPWTSQSLRTTGQDPLPRRNKLTGTLSNVASLTIDMDAACLDSAGLVYDVESDGPVKITFDDGRVLAVDGKGRHTGTVRATSGGGEGGAGNGPQLPATGGGAVVGPLVLLAAGGMLRRRLRRV
jgi:pimeloyl-ACP methyl ester carboxylesterase